MSSKNIKNLVQGAIDATKEITSDDAKEIIKEFLKDQTVTVVNKVQSYAVKKAKDEIAKGMEEVRYSAVEHLKRWMEEKLDSTFDKEGCFQLATLSSNICTLNVASQVMAVGEGFVKTNFTLNKILNTVEDIQKNIKILLEAPLAESVLHFKSSINMIKAGEFKKANENLRLVREKATTATVYSNRKDISVEEFEEAARCVQILIVSNILYISYDEENTSFCPHELLSKEKRELIGKEIREIVDQFFKLNENVVTKSYFFFDPMKNEKRQQIVSEILKSSYSYISETHGWTCKGTPIEMNQTKLKINVAPGYLPEDSKTQITVGTRKLQKQTEEVSISLWVSNGSVFASHPSAETVQKKRIESEASIMELEVHFPVSCLPEDATTIVLSSDEPASGAGSYLGQYEFDKTKNCWIQASSDRNHRNYLPRFIYKVDGDGWYINDSLWKKDGRLRNDARTNTLPLAGWKVRGEVEDPTLSITIGAMETNGDNLTITLSGKPAKEVPEVQGRYKKQNLMWHGHHVYKQSNGHYLYVHWYYYGGCWAVGSELGGDYPKLKGDPVPSCPSKATFWQFKRGYGDWPDCSSSVTIKTD